ncbi:MAG TPA: 50S ribosomal protein L11 methyltransferase [Candidatus Omnitrophota bacterium]|nr:50S ribosomal protein L11 methyltransferase [Candidatus Omnitrophota bacterium]
MMFEIRIIPKASDAGQADLIRCVLINAGVSADRIIEQYSKSRCAIIFYERSRRRREYFVRLLKSLKLHHAAICVRAVASQDWASAWKKYFRPFNITPDIRVIPLWMKNEKVPRGSIPIYLDTTFAFGSGLHATTRMMARLMYSRKGSLESFLDIGTGSGILALIAGAYGSRCIHAIDIDPVAIRTAAANCATNRCEVAHLAAEPLENMKTRRKFDFVAANLLTEDLIRLRKKLISAVAPAKYLAVSGIYRDNYREFRRRFRSDSLRCAAVARQKGWYAVLFQKVASSRSRAGRG